MLFVTKMGEPCSVAGFFTTDKSAPASRERPIGGMGGNCAGHDLSARDNSNHLPCVDIDLDFVFVSVRGPHIHRPVSRVVALLKNRQEDGATANGVQSNLLRFSFADEFDTRSVPLLDDLKDRTGIRIDIDVILPCPAG